MRDDTQPFVRVDNCQQAGINALTQMLTDCSEPSFTVSIKDNKRPKADIHLSLPPIVTSLVISIKYA